MEIQLISLVLGEKNSFLYTKAIHFDTPKWMPTYVSATGIFKELIVLSDQDI